MSQCSHGLNSRYGTVACRLPLRDVAESRGQGSRVRQAAVEVAIAFIFGGGPHATQHETSDGGVLSGRAGRRMAQSPLRTGLTTGGFPGSALGIQPQDPTIAEVLKPQGGVCGQSGKNPLGDRNEFLPTVHGFDGFFGNLYHLNAEEEPENIDYPKDPNFLKNFGPRGVLKCVATDVDDPTEVPRFGKWGKQKCDDTGPLTV